MASKEFTLKSGLPVTIYKRRSSRNLRLSIGAHGKVRVTIPAWAPYKAGLAFAESRQAWITAQQKPAIALADGQAIGKAHHLVFVAGHASRTAGRLSGGTIKVTYPAGLSVGDPAVQTAAREAAVRALRQQAESLLPQRLADLAAARGFSYKAVKIKRLQGRWGSCDRQANIVLNLFLMQLPWGLIDYVLVHELVHTRVLKHGPEFWQAMAAELPDVKELRRQLRDYHPVIE